MFPHGRVAVEVVDGGLRAPPALENGRQLCSLRMYDDACCHQCALWEEAGALSRIALCQSAIMLMTLCTQAGQQRGTWYIAVATVTIGY